MATQNLITHQQLRDGNNLPRPPLLPLSVQENLYLRAGSKYRPISEEEIAAASEKFGFLSSHAVGKPCGGIRVINCIPNDLTLRERLPDGLDEEYYSQDFLAYTARQLLNELRIYTGHNLHPQAYGFAQGKTNLDAFRMIADGMRNGKRYALVCDIRNCFPSVDIEALFQEVLQELEPIRPELCQALRRLNLIERYDHLRDARVPSEGLAQGISPSPLLLGLYLRQMDDYCAALTEIYLRLFDDFILLFETAMEAERVKLRIEWFLNRHYPSIRLNSQKTRIVEAGELIFGGYRFRADRLITLPELAIQQSKRRYDELSDIINPFTRGRQGCLLKKPPVGSK